VQDPLTIRNTFFHKNNTSTEIQQHNIFFLAGDSINFFSAAKSKSFFGQPGH
jgi:hypothetical protein